MPPILTRNSDYKAVAGASAQFATTLVSGTRYLFTSSTACWVKIGLNPVAAVQTIGSIYVPANIPHEFIAQGDDAKVAVIQAAAGGDATLTQVAA